MLKARVREEECVGCTKCISACPVDAIIGASKFLHIVLTEECIGCQLCVAPCPMDCIEMVEDETNPNIEQKTERAQHAKQRYLARQKRLLTQTQPRLHSSDSAFKLKIRTEIQASIERVKQKKD